MAGRQGWYVMIPVRTPSNAFCVYPGQGCATAWIFKSGCVAVTDDLMEVRWRSTVSIKLPGRSAAFAAAAAVTPVGLFTGTAVGHAGALRRRR